VILFKKAGETVHPLALNLFKDILALGLFIVTIAVMGDNPFPHAPQRDYLLLLLSGAIGIGLGDTLFLKSLNILGASITSIVDCAYIPFVVGLSMIFLGDLLSVWQVVGIMAIVSSILIVSIGNKDGNSVSHKDRVKGWIYGISAWR